jgi:phage terminase large subunit-like protein
LHRFHKYIKDVQTRNVLTGELLKLTIERHLTDLETSGFEYYFDEKQAERFIKFFEVLRHWKGDKAKQRIILEPYQVFIFGCIYGWREKGTKLKRWRTTYVDKARKNAKTTEAAGMALYHLIAENESGAQVYSGATKEAQSTIVVNDAGQIVKQSMDVLKNLPNPFTYVHYSAQIKRVVYGNSYFAPLGRDSNTSDGFDPSFGIIDEYHAHKSDEILNVIESGMGSRRQPMISIITTAGFNKAHPCYSVTRKTAIEILKGVKKDDRFFAAISTLDDGDDWNDQNVWIKSNPLLGASLKLDYLQSRYLKAQNQGGSTEVDFKTKNLNIWTDAAAVWIKDEIWQKNTGYLKDKNELKGHVCFGGLDLAKSYDINAFCLIFPYFNPAFIPVLFWFWIPEAKVKTVEEFDYQSWVSQGFIKATEGNVCNPDLIANDVLDIIEPYKCSGIGFDRYAALHGCVQTVIATGMTTTPITQYPSWLSEPTKKMEEIARQGRFEHFDNPVIRWMVGNVELMTDSNGNIKADKGKSINKIDGVSAMVNAIFQWLITENNEREASKKNISIYEKKDLLII